MANWKNLARAALLADKKIDRKETLIIQKEIFADDIVDKSELEFLADLRNSAESCVPSFTKLFFDAVKKNLLADGEIDDKEAKWLRKTLYADNKIDKDEIQLLKDLKKEATSVGKDFEELYDECVKGKGTAAKTPSKKPAKKPSKKPTKKK